MILFFCHFEQDNQQLDPLSLEDVGIGSNQHLKQRDENSTYWS